MEIESIDIKYYFYSGFSMNSNDGMVHTKSLPYLSIVQSQIGSYDISIDNEPPLNTGENNFFIAPSGVVQRITHHLNQEQSLFKARYIFLDIIINQKYQFDDVFDIPTVLDTSESKTFDDDFNEYELADCICEKMRCIYKIIKHLIEISGKKNVMKNNDIYSLIDYIKTNYAKNITISTMADILKMSESNLYAVFKKSTGMSPIKYLNEYRLSVAATLLLQTTDSIKEIAYKVGITDQFYFSKLFKSKYSMSPHQFRKEQY